MIGTAPCTFLLAIRWLFDPCITVLTLFHHRTFLKRKGGLFKKAHELSVLCSVDVAVVIFGNNKKLYEYSSSDMGEILQRYNFVSTKSLRRWRV